MAKNFKDNLPTVDPKNPALQFISEANPEPESDPQATQTADTSPELTPEFAAIMKAYLRRNPQVTEKRSARMQIVISPRLKSEIADVAEKQGISSNELVNRAIIAYIEGDDE